MVQNIEDTTVRILH